jgi:PKD repeat protein
MSTPSPTPTPTPTPSPSPAPVPMTPALNSTGLFTVNAPFTISSDILYTCKAINSYAALVAAGVNVYAIYYEANGLTQQQYQADYNAGANIVTLMSTTAASVLLPDTYITSVPNSGNVAYVEFIATLNLGPLPQATSLALLQQQLADAASNVIGVTPTVVIFTQPTTDVMSQEQAAAAEAARQSAITNRTSDYAAYLKLQQQYATLQANYTTLSQLAIAKGILTPGPSPAPTPSPTPVAQFKAAVVQYSEVSFQDTSTDSNTIQAWSWDFGDGAGSSALKNPVYTYAASGTYNVILTITDSTGQYSSLPVAVTVTVAPAPTPSPSPTPTPSPSP